MRKIEFSTTLYVDGYSTDEDLVWSALRYGEKHQDFTFGTVVIHVAEDYNEEE